MWVMKNRLGKYIRKFHKAKLLVVGDIMLDRFVYGTVSRISPEAPVPVVEVTKEVCVAGGAGNVCNNIASLEGTVYLVGVIGKDENGEKLLSTLNSRNIITDGIFVDKSRPTTIKTRVVAHHQQVVRFDHESKSEIPHSFGLQIFNCIKKIIPEVSSIVISDYGKGVIKPFVLENLIRLSQKYKIPIIVDPKIEHFTRYRNVTCLTPNLQEAISGMRIHYKITNKQDIVDLGKRILKRLNPQAVIITLGEKGMMVFEQNKKPIHIPTQAKEVFDVTGAGDTVVAVLSICLASGLSIRQASCLANYAAGIVVGKLGTATVLPEELEQAISE